MAQDDEKMKRLEGILTETHRNRPEPLLGPDWGNGVMREICRLAAQQDRWSESPRVELLVWRTAAVAATVAIVLTMSILALSWVGVTDNASMLVEEAEVAALFPE